MPSCSVMGCLQRKVSDGITLHRFPHDPVQRQRWVDALRRENFVPGKSAVVCSRHFAEEDIDRTSLVCVRIRANAVPAVFPDCPSRSRKRGRKVRERKSRSLSSDVTSEQSKDEDHGQSAVLSASSSAETSSSSTPSMTSPTTASTSSPSTTATSSPSTTATSSPSTTATSSPSTTATSSPSTTATSSPSTTATSSTSTTATSSPSTTATSSTYTSSTTSSTSTPLMPFPTMPSNSSTSVPLSASTSKQSAPFLTMPLASSNYTTSSSTSTPLATSSTTTGSTSPNPETSPGTARPAHTSLNLHFELKLGRSQQQLESSRKQIKILLQNKRRLNRRNARLKSMITDLKKQNSMRSETLQVFEKSPTGVADLLKRHTAKQLNEVLPCSYSAELKRFAQTLHYCSPRAYRYVRKMFNTCLPHPRTIERWHSGTDGSLELSSGTLQDSQDHFEESQFEGIARSPTGGKKLKPNAVPTLFNVPNPPLPIAQHTHSTLPYKPDTESDLKVGDHGYARRQPRAELEEDELLRAEEERPCSLCQHYKSQLEQQQQHTARLQREVEEMKKRLHRLSRMEKGLQVFLFEDQIRALTLSKRSRRAVWSHDTILTAQKIRCAVGVKGYEFLRELGYPLPSYRTLCNRLEPKIMMSESMQEDLAELGLGIITACDSADENTASEEALIGMMT